MKRTVTCCVKSSTMVSRLEQQLYKRQTTGKLRALQPINTDINQVDFSSNDYLGLSRNEKLIGAIEEDWKLFRIKQSPGTPHLGSTGSRLLSGNSAAYEETERYLADFHGHSHCLLANSGWDLNFGLLSCVPSKNTVVFYDDLSHNSLIMGLENGRQSKHISFAHNDIGELRDSLLQQKKDSSMNNLIDSALEALIVVESVYSMDGDICPINELFEVAEEFNAMVLIDEAHSTAVIGDRGEGLISSLGLQKHKNLLG
jgi:8-amino-7-oxononanoate synthase